MTSYMLTDAHDNQIADGIQTLAQARQCARQIADRTGAPVYIHDEDGDADEVQPTVHIAISVGTPSEVSDSEGALDYDVTMTIGEREVEGQITLWPDPVNGGMSPGGTPVDGWISAPLLAAIRKLSGEQSQAVLRSLAALSEGEVDL